MKDTQYLVGIVGTGVGAVGTSMSVTEVQAIVSIVVTVLGFIISVIIPLCIKLYTKIKKANEDGEITPEEIDDINKTLQEGSEEIKQFIDNNKKKED